MHKNKTISITDYKVDFSEINFRITDCNLGNISTDCHPQLNFLSISRQGYSLCIYPFLPFKIKEISSDEKQKKNQQDL
jgi:hypothetical protein